MMKKKQVVRRMGGGAMKKQVAKRMGGGAMKKQVAKRMGGGAMKKQVVKKRGGGSMGKSQRTIGGDAKTSQHKRLAMGFANGGMASPDTRGRALGRMTRDAEGRALPVMTRRKKQTANDRLDERLGMRDGSESTKTQSMKSRRDESRAMKRGGSMKKKQVVKKRGGGAMTPMQMRKGGNTSRMNKLEELGRVNAERARTSKGKKNLIAEKRRIIFELAKKRKPSGRLNVDDIERASKEMKKRKK